MSKCVVKNIKISIRIDKSENIDDILREKKFEDCYRVTKVTQSSFTYRSNKFVYVIFNGGHINVTNISSIEEIPSVKLELINYLNLSTHPNLLKLTIDNIVACGKVSPLEHFHSFLKFCRNKKIKSHYNPERFPGAKLSIYGKTVIFFRSGAYNVLGLKSLEKLDKIQDCVTYLCDEYQRLSSSCQ